jgi:hypothetical protein
MGRHTTQRVDVFLRIPFPADVSDEEWACGSGSFGCKGQVLVFHFPGVIHGVKGGVADEEAEWPGAGHLALSVERSNGLAIGVALGVQCLVGERRVRRRVQ